MTAKVIITDNKIDGSTVVPLEITANERFIVIEMGTHSLQIKKETILALLAENCKG